MPTIGSVTKTIRIAPADLVVIEGLMKDGTSWSGAIHKLCAGEKAEKAGTPSKKSKKSGASPNNDLKEVESMANFFGLTLDEMLSKICEGLMDGTLTIENGRIAGVPEVNLDDFKEVCHEKGFDLQKALDKATQSIRRG